MGGGRGVSGLQIKTVPCRFVPVTRCHYRKFGLASNCRLNLIQFDLYLTRIERYHGKNFVVDSNPRSRSYQAPRCPSPDTRRLASRVPDVAQGENWWRNVYTRRFAATYTCTRACAHTRLLASRVRVYVAGDPVLVRGTRHGIGPEVEG